MGNSTTKPFLPNAIPLGWFQGWENKFGWSPICGIELGRTHESPAKGFTVQFLPAPVLANGRKKMSRTALAAAMFIAAGMVSAAPTASAAPCLIVTLTGTKGGPNVFEGLAGPGTLVRYGEDSNACGSVKLQFDVGRGTTLRLSQLGVQIEELNAIFFTHIHSDHADGFADLMQQRWHFLGPKVDVVCSSDTVTPQGFVVSCRKLAMHIADPYIESGEIAQRHFERKETVAGRPGGFDQCGDV
jgi:ribonuclease Z